MKKNIFLVLIFLSFNIQAVDFFSEDQFDITGRMEFFNIPGVSIAVVNNGEVSWAKGFGIANKTSLVNKDTLFQAASISKPITALAVLKLVEDGLLDLDTDVNTYLKEWHLGNDIYLKNRKVTLRLLLTHLAGIHSSGPRGYLRGETLPSIVDLLNGTGRSTKVAVHYFPGLKFRYSWGGYTLIQKIIEDVTGQTFEEYLQKNILDPIGMSRSTFKQPLPLDLEGNVSSGFDLYGKEIEGSWRSYPDLAASGLWSTPTDIAKYCIEIQKILGGEYEGVISLESVYKMLTPHLKNWGLGPSLKFNDEELIFRHSGKNAGFTNYFIAKAYKGEAIIIMNNGDNGWKLIMEILHSIQDYRSWGL